MRILRLGLPVHPGLLPEVAKGPMHILRVVYPERGEWAHNDRVGHAVRHELSWGAPMPVMLSAAKHLQSLPKANADSSLRSE